ncbi:hypothetical protein EJF36_07760 [Bacillus sp. HMF5848]|uniref:hypothetical protein n=1 Tax=Bacillus sp. HMF5848 TaxID=2495421 RepID=UPI000F7B37E1|nr:hypothetical protein [Bacillus sp. HMF5848]RSK26764.1 hypothetical protein EJF36_07760 [Bacillus sp. HMF5848]
MQLQRNPVIQLYTKNKPVSSNQSIYKISPLSTFASEQLQFNSNVTKAIHDNQRHAQHISSILSEQSYALSKVNETQAEHTLLTANKWKHIEEQWQDTRNKLQDQDLLLDKLLTKLQLSTTLQNEYKNSIIQELSRYDEKVTNLSKRQHTSFQSLEEKIMEIENAQKTLTTKNCDQDTTQQAIIDQLTHQDIAFAELTRSITKHVVDSETITEKLLEQKQLNEELQAKLLLQEMFHQTILEKMEKQDALLHKLSRQIDHIKSVIFERFSFIVDKIDIFKQKNNTFTKEKEGVK